MDRIAARLSAVDDLYFPTAFLRDTPSPPRRREALLALLSRDAPLFLERYGTALEPLELATFNALEADYEVAWHLRHLRRVETEAQAPAAAGGSVRVRNQRRAYLNRLVLEGDYFSEEAMREREPYLKKMAGQGEVVGLVSDAGGTTSGGRGAPSSASQILARGLTLLLELFFSHSASIFGLARALAAP